MKKVLMVAGQMHMGGLEIMLMNFLRNIDREKVHIDFLLHYKEKGDFDDEIRSLGSKIYVMPKLRPQNVFKYIASLCRFFREHRGEYDIVHGNITSSGIIYLTIAKIFGVKTRIIHAHYGDVKGNHHEKLERIMLKPLRFCANYYFACSDRAGEFCFGKNILKRDNYFLIRNGVDITKFSFDEAKRNKKREEMGLSNKFVLLHVGRFESEKNHSFILDFFSEYIKTDKEGILLFAGVGSLENEIKEKARTLGLSDRVLFLGLRNDVNQFLLAADVFVLPSIFEGLPVVGIEAQASGIKCLFSENVTRELDITGNCEFLPINDTFLWCRAIEKAREFKRVKTDEKIVGAGYEIHAQAKWLENFYLNH